MSNARRTLELELGPTGPWRAHVRVWVIDHHGGRKSSMASDYVFEVQAEWTGPPAVGFPPSDRPVSASDTYTVAGGLEDARALARRAAEAFAAGGDYPPDLRELATGKPAAEQEPKPRLWLPE